MALTFDLDSLNCALLGHSVICFEVFTVINLKKLPFHNSRGTYQTAKINYPRRSYDVISIFQMAAGSHIGFYLGNIRPPTKCNCWSQLGPQIGLDPI